MFKKSLLKKSKYIVASLLGLMVFMTAIPSCTRVSFFDFNTPISLSKTEKQSDIVANKSIKNIIVNLPSPKTISKMPLTAHPRLLVSDQRFAEIKKQIKTDKKMEKWYKKILFDAEQFLVEEPPVYELENSIGMILISKLAIKRIETLAILYRLNGDQRYLDRVWQELKAISEFPNWNPSHFLDTAEMTFAFAIAYDWLYSDWNDREKLFIRNNILEKGLKPALDGYRHDEWWTKAKNNWNQVCNGGIGIGALAIIDSNPDLSSKILHKVLNRLPIAMEHYAPDGAWEEGLNYWHYGTSYTVAFLDALEISLGSDFDLPKIAGFAQTGFFPIYGTGASGYPFNFADGQNKKISYPELFWLSEKFNQPVFAEFQKQMSMAEPMDLIWNKNSVDKNYREKLPLDRYFRDAEVVTMRSSWQDPLAAFVGFKAGDNQASHSHLDLGSFVLDALGIRWAMDLGKDKYGLPGYFETEDQRWTYYRMRAEGQNTIVVNPDKSPEQNPDAEAKIKRFSSKVDRAYAITDLTLAYYPSVSRLVRGVALQDKRQQILIQDEIKANSPIDLWWFMHTRAKIKLAQNDNIAILYQGGVRLGMKILSPIDAHFKIMPAEPLPNSPNPEGQLENRGVEKLAIEIKQVDNTILSVLLFPLKDKQNLPKKFPKVTKISQW